MSGTAFRQIRDFLRSRSRTSSFAAETLDSNYSERFETRLFFALEAIASASVFGHLFGHFQECSSGVREHRFLTVYQA